MPETGVYHLSASVPMFSLTNESITELYVYVNGTKLTQLVDYRNGSSSAVTYHLNGSVDMNLTSGDTVDLRVWQNTGLSRNFGGANTGHFSIHKL